MVAHSTVKSSSRRRPTPAKNARAQEQEQKPVPKHSKKTAPAEEPRTNERINLPSPDYEADDVLVVRRPEQLRALGDDLRSKIVILLRDRAYSTTELADKLQLPKGTVGHHVKVLEKAGLVRVVRTRRVRALTEKYYGRTARLFLFKSADADGEDVRNVAAASLRRAAEEMLPIGDDARTTFAVVRANLTDADARRLTRRLERLVEDFCKADSPDGTRAYGLAASLYERATDA